MLQIDANDDDVNAVSFADASSQILFSGADDGLCKVNRFLYDNVTNNIAIQLAKLLLSDTENLFLFRSGIGER